MEKDQKRGSEQSRKDETRCIEIREGEDRKRTYPAVHINHSQDVDMDMLTNLKVYQYHPPARNTIVARSENDLDGTSSLLVIESVKFFDLLILLRLHKDAIFRTILTSSNRRAGKGLSVHSLICQVLFTEQNPNKTKTKARLEPPFRAT